MVDDKLDAHREEPASTKTCLSVIEEAVVVGSLSGPVIATDGFRHDIANAPGSKLRGQRAVGPPIVLRKSPSQRSGDLPRGQRRLCPVAKRDRFREKYGRFVERQSCLVKGCFNILFEANPAQVGEVGTAVGPDRTAVVAADRRTALAVKWSEAARWRR